ncbi:Sodium and chloride-dependent GABA transporter 3 [Taenia solium]|eukprot:TsM_000821100 transcript=TsM_000821100 gene=TsM_000821100
MAQPPPARQLPRNWSMVFTLNSAYRGGLDESRMNRIRDWFRTTHIWERKKRSEIVSPTSTERSDMVERSEWDRPVQFILSLVGYAVGLGSIWRFPYIAMINGGGAFLVPYIIFMLFCGIPFCYMEFTLGQFTGLSPVKSFEFLPLLKGLGWSMLLVSGMLCVYYNIVMAWVIFYFTQSFQWNLPWKSCNNSWNTPTCFSYMQMTNLSSIRANGTSSTMEFWNHRVLEISASIDQIGGVNWNLFGCMVAAWAITFLCLFKGIKSSGKVGRPPWRLFSCLITSYPIYSLSRLGISRYLLIVVYVTALAPYLFLTLLVIRGVTLPGAFIGLEFYLKPDWEQLKSFKGLVKTNVHFRDAVILPVVCGGTSIFGGLAVFSITGHMAYQMNSEDVTALMLTGPGLAFIAYPDALGRIPGAAIWTVLFFAMLFTLGLDTQFATLETMTSGFVDRFPNTLGKHKTLFTLLVCCAQFGLGFILVTRVSHKSF